MKWWTLHTDQQQSADPLPFDVHTAEWKAVVPKVLISVKGGDAASTSALKESINIDGEMNTETYQKWLRSIPDYPGLLHSEVQPQLMTNFDLTNTQTGAG